MMFNDNIFLRQEGSVSTWGISATPEIGLRKRTPTSAINVGVSPSFNRYSESAIRDNDIFLLTTSGYYRSQRSRLRWNGFYKSDTTTRMITEIDETLDEDDLESIESDGGITDQHLVGIEIRRNQIRLGPTWTMDLSRITSLRVGYQFNDVEYSGARDVLSDYQTHGLNFGISRQISSKSTLGATVAGTRYESADAVSRSDSYDITLSLDRAFTPLLQGSMALGARSTRISSGNVDDESTGMVANARLSGKYSELTSYSIRLERNVRPSGARTVIVSDLLRTDLSHAMSPLMTLSIRTTAFNNRSLDRSRTSSDRKYYTFEVGLHRRITRLWDIEGTYRYRRLDFDDDNFSSDSNSVSISAIYSWPRISVSR